MSNENRSPKSRMSPRQRKLVLTIHIACAVGWLGAVVSFLVLSIVGLTNGDPEIIRSVYLSMDFISRYAVIPFSFATLLTGLFQAIASPWGLLRYYWIMLKLGLAFLATLALLIHQSVAVSVAAQRVIGAAPETLLSNDFMAFKIELVRAPSLAIAVLLVALTLAVYKPWGLTAFGRRTQATRAEESVKKSPFGFRIFLVIIGLLGLAFILLHLTGQGFHH